MKRIITAVALLCATFSGFTQTVPQAGQFVGIMVPQVMGSGTSTRLPVVFRGVMTGLQPNTKYKYAVSGITASDLSSTTTVGAGNPIFFDTSGTWKASTTGASLTTGAGHDTFTTDMGGTYEGWFGFYYTGNSRFTAGNKIYPLLQIRHIDSTTTERHYITDSILVCQFSTAAGANNATGIYGKSAAAAKNFILMYDNVLGMGRPVSITFVENDGITGSSMVGYYSSNVEGKNGCWGTLIPNSLSDGIRRVTLLGLKSPVEIFANTDADGIWGNKDTTFNPRGGSSKPIFLDDWQAPLTNTMIEFWARTSTIGEGSTSFKVFVKRQYANESNSTVNLTLVGGSATNGSGKDYQVSLPKSITFKPGPTGFDTTTITITNDDTVEGPETIVLRLQNVGNAVLGTEVAHTATIVDDDLENIQFNTTSVTVREDARKVAIPVKLGKALSTQVKFKVVLIGKSDSLTIPGEVKFGTNNTDTLYTIDSLKVPTVVSNNLVIYDDTKPERNDTLVFAIRSTTGFSEVGPDSLLTVIIQDDDGPVNISFSKPALSITESTPSFRIRVNLSNRNNKQVDFGVRLNTALSTATETSDFTYSPTTKLANITTADPDSFIITVPVKNDDIYENHERIVFTLVSLSNAKIISPDTFKVTILNDDVPTYTIGKVTTVNGTTGVNDSLNKRFRIRGTVYGGNLHPQGLLFTLHDGTGGVQVYAPSKNFGYTVSEGDSIMVQGALTQYQGMAQMALLDTVVLVKSGNSLRAAQTVTALNENLESELVKISLVKLVNPADWPTAPMSANTTKLIAVKNATQTFDILIDSETDMDGKPAPSGYLEITGLEGQSDASSPYTGGYYIAPRRLNDIVTLNTPVISFSPASQTKAETFDSTDNINLSISNATRAFQVTVVLRGGTATLNNDYVFSNPTVYSLAQGVSTRSFKLALTNDNQTEPDETVFLVLRNNTWGSDIGADSVFTLTIKDDEPTSVFNTSGYELSLTPNPASGHITISSEENFSAAEITDISGRIVLRTETGNSRKARLDISQLQNGIYLIRTYSDNGLIQTGRFLKNQ